MSGGRWLLLLLLLYGFLGSPWARVQAQPSDHDEFGPMVRARYFANAFREQESAYLLCVYRIGEVESGAVDGDLANLQRRRGEYLNDIESTGGRLIDTLLDVSEELEDLGEAIGAYNHLIAAAETRDAIAAYFQDEAHEAGQESRDPGVASKWLKAQGHYSRAATLWNAAVDFIIRQDTDFGREFCEVRARESNERALRCLEEAISIYYRAHSFYVERAQTAEADVYAGTAGDDWIRAAEMNQRYEQLLEELSNYGVR